MENIKCNQATVQSIIRRCTDDRTAVHTDEVRCLLYEQKHPNMPSMSSAAAIAAIALTPCVTTLSNWDVGTVEVAVKGHVLLQRPY